MWFKNLRIYRFTKPFELSPEELEPLLAEKRFHPCGRQDLTRYGWVSPLGPDSETLTHACNGNIMLCAQREDKVIPSSVIKEAIAEKVDFLQAKEGRKVFKKEKEQIKDEVMLELLPRAFCKRQTFYGYIAPRDGLLLLDVSSASKAEQFLGHLRDSLGSLPLVLPISKQLPGDVMTRWLEAQQVDEPFMFDKECELSNPADGANIIRCKSQDMDTGEVQTLLESGKRCTKLAVNWKDNIRCVIEEDLSLKRLKFEDQLLEKASESEAETKAQQFDEDFAIMSLELAELCTDLFKAFGGLESTRKI